MKYLVAHLASPSAVIVLIAAEYYLQLFAAFSNQAHTTTAGLSQTRNGQNKTSPCCISVSGVLSTLSYYKIIYMLATYSAYKKYSPPRMASPFIAFMNVIMVNIFWPF